MLAEAFVSAGCTYCDKDDVKAFLEDQQPNLLVLRRSFPHAGQWPGMHDIFTSISRHNYGMRLLCIVREPFAAKHSVMKRSVVYKAFEYEEAFRKCGEYVDRWGGIVVPYEYFVSSKWYRKSLFEERMDLPEPQMEFYDGNAKYYE